MSKAISRRDFMKVTGVVGRSWSAGCLRRQFFQHCSLFFRGIRSRCFRRREPGPV